MSREVCVITGGGSGLGLAAAKCVSKEKLIVIAGRTVSKLEHAVQELQALGFEAQAHACDVSRRESVRELAEYAASQGTIRNVINSAGVSPNMAEAETIIRVNALGTVYVNQEFARVMGEGSVIVDIASSSAHSLPTLMINKKVYEIAEINEHKFIAAILKFPGMMKDAYKSKGLAYALSKNFVKWYAQKSAFTYGGKGIRVVSLSPGLIATDMGKLEAEEGRDLIEYSCEKRMGKPEEIGFAIAMLADERNGYLAGVDVLCDGGSTTGKKMTSLF